MAEEHFDSNMKTLEFRLLALHEDVRDVRGSMNKLADAITKLALIEERQAQSGNLLARAFAKLDEADARLKSLEIQAPSANRASQWLDRGVIFAVGALVMFVLKKVGFFN